MTDHTMINNRARYQALGRDAGNAELRLDNSDLAANLLLFDVLSGMESSKDLTAANQLFNVGYELAINSVTIH